MRLSMLTEQISCVEQNKEVIEQKIITMDSPNNPGYGSEATIPDETPASNSCFFGTVLKKVCTNTVGASRWGDSGNTNVKFTFIEQRT